MGIKASSQVTVVDVTDAYSVTLTSETYTFLGDTTGAPAGSSCTTQVVAYCGDKICSVASVAVTCPDGISATITDSQGKPITGATISPTIEFKIDDGVTITNACEALITVKVDDVLIDKKFSFAVAKTGPQGEQGIAGNGIKSVVRYYKLATSTPSTPTTNPPSGWTTTEPTYTSGSTDNLYLVDCTIYTDETFAFSSVSLNSSYAAAKDAYDLADGKPTLNTVKNTIKQSLANYGENLVLNGNASFRNNTNFSSFGYLSYNQPHGDNHTPFYNVNAGDGYFTSSNTTRRYLDNLIPIDTNRTYELSVYALSRYNNSSLELGCMFYENATRPILPAHVSWVDGTTTKLAKDLNKGDPVVYLESVENFQTTIENDNNGLIFWDYTGVNGHTFEPETYSRNVYKGLWSDGTMIDKEQKTDETTNETYYTITLPDSGWPGVKKCKGTYVSQSVGYYNSSPISGIDTVITEVLSKAAFKLKTGLIASKNEITYISHTFGGIGTNWEDNKFPSGCDYIRLYVWGRRGSPAFTNLSLISRDVTNLLTRVTEAETSITTNKNAIELKAEKTEVTTAVDSVTKDIGDLRGDLANYATQDDYESVKTSISTLTQTSNDFTMKFQEIDSKFGDQSKYIRYSEDGIEIGYLDDESNTGVSETKKKLKLTLDNDRISFTSDGKVLGYWDGNYFYTGNIYVETKQQARFGNFAFTPYDDGSLAFVRVGE